MADPQQFRKRARHALDCAVLLGVQKALRNGTVWAPCSLSYISRNAMLLNEREWTAHRKRHYRVLDLPRQPSTFLAPRLAMLRAGLSSVADAVRREEKANVKLHFIQPGKPTQNAFVESFNGKMRVYCLDLHWFAGIDDARSTIDDWQRYYNHVRPHRSLGKKRPAVFAKEAA